MSAIEQCRSAALGGHLLRCTECAHTDISYSNLRYKQ
ncbi:transposase zinc-binding domain-containing protein [Acidithiobacillus ferriphilus]|nr:transposase zinc-binding domain-containing protein [Acidithiobacillus ferriphilus]